MNATVRTVSTAIAGRVSAAASVETQELMALGTARGWDFRVLGQAPLPEEPVRLGDWLLVPAHQDSSPIPPRALARLRAIFEVGLRPKGFVLVHEAPKLLPAPAQAPPESWRVPLLPPHVTSVLKRAGTVAGAAVLGVAALTGALVLALVAVLVVAVALVPLALVAGAVMVDPILVAVTEDGYWIEIDRWESP